MTEVEQVSAITNRFYLILQEFTETDAYNLIEENNKRPIEKRFDFVASNMKRITPEARDILKANNIPVVFY